MNDDFAQFLDGKSDPHSASMVLDGIQSALRLVSSASAKTRGERALPKWRLLRVLAYIDSNISKTITLSDLSAARRAQLLKEASPLLEADTGRIRGPVGLDIGAKTPAGIALAIAAQIHAVLGIHEAAGC
jgi:hypothetical protein